MNDRIHELAERTTNSIGWCIPSEDERWIEKFTELVVKECVRVVDETMTENQEMNIGLVMASAAIVSHFEIEE